MKLDGIRACVFDAYGTLFDVHAPVAKVAAALGDKADAVSRMWRDKQLQYTWLRSLMGAHADFLAVTADALDYALAAHGVSNAPLRARLLDLYMTLDAYPDARRCLETLKSKGLTTAILSNGSPAMLDAATKSAGLDAQLDHVLSIEQVGIYKPDPRVYQLAVDELGIPAADMLFVSMNPWDASGAANFGFKVARLNRLGVPPDNLPGDISAEVATLDAIPDLVS
ncbi:haloacid dehalogenase type II [Microbaculum marinisediminis]|uniref:(S)-2-haloacid dehalogenase n=1 Tax=Microbaculum marinisediminis TaxID=2931392 RepID=A0AAW5QXA7_9HYPH|nr:haloacid dehalogenase type II [Microbaculum sp. A6E488]MCT8971605.1 haloacid dehalogenase type II [Microbaculum sp. A6E488]